MFPIVWCGAADAPGVGRARAAYLWRSQRMIQPRDCCGLTANAYDRACERYRRERIHCLDKPARGRPSDGIPYRASDRHRVHQRWERLPSEVIMGNARRRQPGWQVSAALRRGAAQPAHAARRRSGERDRADFPWYHDVKAFPTYRGGAADAPGVGQQSIARVSYHSYVCDAWRQRCLVLRRKLSSVLSRSAVSSGHTVQTEWL